MNFYYYLFTCAYWVSVKDLKEKSAPQEYAFLFVYVLNLFWGVLIFGLVNLLIGENIMSGTSVIAGGVVLYVFNHFLFLWKKKYLKVIYLLEKIGYPENKGKRIRTMIVTFVASATVAIMIATLNNSNFRNWLFQ